MTHINAFLAEAEEAVAAAKAAVQDAEAKLEGLRARVNSDQEEAQAEPPKAPGASGAASEGELQSKSKNVKYK